MPNTPLNKEAARIARSLCADANAIPLLLTVFGSELYGTTISGKSDTDIAGIFLPSREELLLGEARGQLRFSTSDDKNRNSSEDMDITLYSLQKWLLELLPKGDIGAIDLLFAPTNKDCLLFKSPLIEEVFRRPSHYLNLSCSATSVQYIMRQVKKYGIKGSRLAVMRNIKSFIEKLAPAQNSRLKDFLEPLLENCGDDRFCCLLDSKTGPALNLGGKFYMPAIKFGEFKQRLETELNNYIYSNDADLDYKAISHALRAADEMEELLTTGQIIFPLRSRAELIKVKQGLYAWEELEPLILKRIERIEHLCSIHKSEFSPAFGRQVILNCYKPQ